MAEAYLGEIRVFAFGIIPSGWMPCDGRILQVSQYTPLFALIGPTYGGNGSTTFALPDLRGRVPMQASGDYPLGRAGGEESHSLTTMEMPAHVHRAQGSTLGASVSSPVNNNWATRSDNPYSAAANGTMAPSALGMTGGNQAHPNMQPYLPLNFCIATIGLWPPRE